MNGYAVGGIVAATALAAAAYGYYASARWRDRGITVPRMLPVAAAAAAAVAGWVAAAAGWPGPYAVTVTATVFLAVTAVVCDLMTRKVPRDLPWAAAAVGIAAAAWSRPDLNTLLLWAFTSAVLVLPFMVAWLIRPAWIGFSDVRLVIAFTVLLGWWVPPDAMMIGMMTTFALQAAAHLATRIRVPGRNGSRSRFLPFAPALTAGMLLAGAVSFAAA